MADKQKAAKPAARQHEAAYTAAEIAINAKRLFGVSQDVATAALKCSHATSLTLSEARTIIQKFAERKVSN